MRTLKPVNLINLTGEFTESKKFGGGSVGSSSQQGDRNTLVVKFPRAQRIDLLRKLLLNHLHCV
jgi:hypothetical protein